MAEEGELITQEGRAFVLERAGQSPQAAEGQCLFLSPQVLGFLFFVAAYFLYKSPSVSSDGLEASLPSQSSASDSPTEQLQSNV